MFAVRRSVDGSRRRWSADRNRNLARTALGVLLMVAAGMAATRVVPASASATFYMVPLTADKQVPPANTDNYPVILTTNLTLTAGETRRVSDNLAVTLSSTEGAEVDNQIVCLDTSGTTDPAVVSGGTNHRGSAAGDLVLTESMLFTAPHAGTFQCQLRANTSDGPRSDYVMTALRASTWLQISSTGEVGTKSWADHSCRSNGDNCIFLGASRDAKAVTLVPDSLDGSTWTAAPDATTFDAVGNFEITSCPNGTSSCPKPQWGDGGVLGVNRTTTSQVFVYLAFRQVYPDGSMCRLNQAPDPVNAGYYYIPNAVHHLMANFHVTAPIASTCGGSRQFVPVLFVQWVSGNPVKIDGGDLNVITSARATSTTTVPKLLGSDETAAVAALKAAGLTSVTTSRIMDPHPAGTVLTQNSPDGTVEPTGSQVLITVSLGQTQVPNVLSRSESDAKASVTQAGLAVGSVSYVNDCVDAGSVRNQDPSGGVSVIPGTAVNISVSTCTTTGGGGGTGGGSGGNPILPK